MHEIKKSKEVLLVKMVSGNTFTSLHNHIKITTKLYSNHHSEPSEIKLNGSHTTTELKKKHIETGRRGKGEEWAGPHPCVVDKNQKEYLRNKGS